MTADRRAEPELLRRDCLLKPGWLEACARDTDPADAALSPLFGPLAPLPPVLVQAGSDDVLIGDADRFAARARSAGTDVTYSRAPGLWHDYPIQAGLVSAADAAVSQAATFVVRVAAGAEANVRRSAVVYGSGG
ncbi:MAG: alpha/beta hydrolase [Actinomycetota bacterium]|nr:alpha/beta hydrolase [Actinomycetota bacterium]